MKFVIHFLIIGFISQSPAPNIDILNTYIDNTNCFQHIFHFLLLQVSDSWHDLAPKGHFGPAQKLGNMVDVFELFRVYQHDEVGVFEMKSHGNPKQNFEVSVAFLDVIAKFCV